MAVLQPFGKDVLGVGFDALESPPAKRAVGRDASIRDHTVYHLK
jgi:hypothetical protein